MDKRFRVAFVLGNGPGLPPAASLATTLQGCFVVGTNRINRSGYRPPVRVYLDQLLEFRTSVPNQLQVTSWVGQTREPRLDDAGRVVLKFARPPAGPSLDPTALACRGSVGAAAAWWTLALGFRRIYLLGCGASVDGSGREHFYDPAACAPPTRATRHRTRLMRKRTAEVLQSGRAFLGKDRPDSRWVSAALATRALDANVWTPKEVRALVLERTGAYACAM